MLLAAAEHVAPALLKLAYTGLRVRVVGEEAFEPARAGRASIFVGWHGRLLPLVYLYRDRNLVMLVSGHRDGEYLARVGRGLGYDSIRGSSTRGGVGALRRMMRALRRGRSLCIAPDGPRGPREVFKPGALQVARLSGAPVIPVLAGADRGWWIEGWDRFLIPKPFARVTVAFGQPRRIPEGATSEDVESQARELELELGRLKALVDGEPG